MAHGVNLKNNRASNFIQIRFEATQPWDFFEEHHPKEQQEEQAVLDPKRKLLR